MFVPIRAAEAKKSRARCVHSSSADLRLYIKPDLGRLRSSVEGCGSASASEATGTAGGSPNAKKKQARPGKKQKRYAHFCWTPYWIVF